MVTGVIISESTFYEVFYGLARTDSLFNSNSDAAYIRSLGMQALYPYRSDFQLLCSSLKVYSLKQRQTNQNQQLTCVPIIVITQVALASLQCNYAHHFLLDQIPRTNSLSIRHIFS
jgi:hypothetical protein